MIANIIQGHARRLGQRAATPWWQIDHDPATQPLFAEQRTKPNTRALVITGALAVLMSAGQVSIAQTQAQAAAVLAPPSDLANVTAPADGVAGGHEVQENRAPRPSRYTLRLRLDDGRYRGFHQDSADDLRVGDRVLIENDRIQQERQAAQK